MTIEEKAKRKHDCYIKYRAKNLAYSKKWKKDHPKHVEKYIRENRERSLALRKIRYQNNKEHELLLQKEYYITNKDKTLSRQKIYKKEQYSVNQQHRLSVLLRNRLRQAIKSKNKAGSAVRDLGCSIAELVSHLEKQFQTGMTWKNQGEWHIDHVAPLISFNLEDREQFLKACHYTNLQPLWATDNIKKGDRQPIDKNIVPE